ncbi:MAG: hypothetical protein K2J83_04180 [Clostridia bacterium]|nr:hypothetical protein [Clostridia bacterium]
METFITIKMTEREYATYKEQQAAIVKAARLAKEIQEDCVQFAQMVYNDLKKVLDGDKVHLGLRTVNLLLDNAEKLLARYEEL